MASTKVESKLVAGGGTSPAADPHKATIDSFEASVLATLRQLHGQIGGNEYPQEQKDFAKRDFGEFMKYMASSNSNALLRLPASNLDLPLSSYFISSSHNTYLTGHQLYGHATVDGYKNVRDRYDPG